MSKIAKYLNGYILGEVSARESRLKQFTQDKSILSIKPNLVMFPWITEDIRKIMRFSWQLAEKKHTFNVTARGYDGSTDGSSLGDGIIVDVSRHMNKIYELDLKQRLVRVAAGANFRELNLALGAQALTIAQSPAGERLTIGGAIAQNLPSEKINYGELIDAVAKMEVVLSNGEVIQTERISKRELSQKQGLQTMEGEIYRSLDSLIEDNTDLISDIISGEKTNHGGYSIELVKDASGSFDLTPLFIGSQGTLGLIVQAIIKMAPRPEEVSYMVAAITTDQELSDLTEKLLELEPSELEFIDRETLKLIESKGGGTPWKLISEKLPETLIFIEFDDKHRARKVKKAAKILDSAGITDAQIASTWEDQETLRSVHHSVATLTNFNERGTAALPLAPDVLVSPEQVPELVRTVRQLLKQNHVEGGIWGHLGSGVVSIHPLINLANLGQRQTVFKFMNELQEAVNAIGGTISGEFSDGRQFAPRK
jgi:FAD/FMN-containing dehydrogenase